MKKFYKRFSILSVFLLLGLFPVQSLFAQWFFSLDVEQEYDSNPFRLIEPEEDYISQLSLGLLKDWSSVSAQYYGNYSLFNKNRDRNNYWQQLYLSGGDSTNFYLLSENRINKSEFNYYNYFLIKGGGNHTFIKNKVIGRIGASLAYNIFQEIPEINNFYFSTYFSVNRSFQTKTSLIGSVTYNYKSYNKNEIKVEEEIDTTASLNKSMDLLSVSMGGGDLSGGSGDGPGPGHGNGGNYDGRYYTNIESPSVSQLRISLRVAQSLAKYTGIALQYYHSISLNGLNRNIIGLDYGYTKESEIFDDPIGYEGPTIGMEFTQIAPYFIILKGVGGKMSDPDSRIGGIDRLASRSRRSEDIDLQMLGVDLHLHVFRLRQNRHRCRGGVDPSRSFG